MKQKRNNRPEGNPSEGVGGPNTFITSAKRRILSFALAVLLGVTALQYQVSASMIVEDRDYPFGQADYEVDSNLTYTMTMSADTNSTLTVKAPCTLTIAGRIYLHGSSKFIIEPGARVVIAPGGSLELGLYTVLTNGGELVNEGSLHGTGFTLQNNGILINTGRMYKSGEYEGWEIQGAGRFDNYGDIDSSSVAIGAGAEPNEIAGITAAFSAPENKAEVDVTGRLPQGANSVTIKLFDEHGGDTISPSREAVLASAAGATASASLDLPVGPVPSTYTVKASFDGVHWAPILGTVTTAAAIPTPIIAVQGGGTEIPKGGSLTLEVTNTGDYNAPSFRWYRDGAATGANSGTLTATEAGTYRVVVNAEGQTAGSNEITLTVQEVPYVLPVSLTITTGESGTFTVSLGEGADAAHSANISSGNTAVATATPTTLTPALGRSGTVTVTGVSAGDTTISIGYSGGSRNNEVDTVRVTVTDATATATATQMQADVDHQGGTRSSGGSSGSSDVAPAKTRLPASAFRWDGDRTLTIDHDGITALGLVSVRWNGKTLIHGTDFTVHQGSVVIRFGGEFLAAQAPGGHTVEVEFLGHTGETTVALGQAGLPAEGGDDGLENDTRSPSTGGDSHNPNTGDSSRFGVWAALLAAAVSGGVLVILRRREGETL